MKSRRVMIGFLMVMMAFSMACSCGLLNNILNKGDGEQAVGGGDEVSLGEEFRSDFGGFAFQQIPGYDTEEAFGIVQMTAPGGDVQSGPGMLFTGGLNTEKLSFEDAIGNLKDSTPDYVYEEPEEIEVDGEDGVALDFTGVYEGKDVVGRIVIVMIGDYHQFICMMVAPPDDWDEVQPLYHSVLDTVKFFEPDPDALDLGEGESWEEAEEEPLQEQVLPTAAPVAVESAIMRQWAVAAVASDQYGDNAWGAVQAVGEPDVDECGDSTYAWAALSPTSYSWIELTYTTPVNPTEINIYQNYNPSAVVEVDIITVDGEEYIAWTGTPKEVDYCPDLMTITIDLVEPLAVNKVRVYIDQSYFNDWTEIDAVELVGMPAGNGQPLDQPQPTGDAETPWSFGLTGCEDQIVNGTDGWLDVDSNQLILLFDGGSVVVPMPDDWREHNFMELGAFVPWETPLPTAQIQFFDRDTIYYTDSGSIWWDYADATHITGMLDFKASEYDTLKMTLTSPVCQVGVWVAFSNISVE
ncbi:MAG: hypothetical protein HPY85_09965 [Anaerolineae bacterium]|nr:hypothetical protein [Anaerolineae bacterium]